ncbi:MAG: hypothetical protein ACKVOK_04825, partial [Flavobacteriales bacterium]
GMERISIRNDIAKAHRHYLIRRWTYGILAGILLIGLIGGIVFAMNNFGHTEEFHQEQTVPEIQMHDTAPGSEVETIVHDNIPPVIPADSVPIVRESFKVFSSNVAESTVEIKPRFSDAQTYQSMAINEAVDITGIDFSKGAKGEYIADAESFLTPQIFKFDLKKPQLIETKEGMVITLDPGSLQDENGRLVTDNIEVTVREAFGVTDILKSGLSTMAGAVPLETDGMFQITACSGEEILSINPEQPIYVSTPSNGLRYDLQLWDGQVQSDGSINWYQPEVIEKFLTPVDISTLDFYPPGFLNALSKENLDVTNREFSDSLYLSFEKYSTYQVAYPVYTIIEPKPDTIVIPKVWIAESDEITGKTTNSVAAIPPSHILAFWQNHFNHTLLATKEFEERMPAIHRTCNPAVLEIYTSNLEKPLYELDEMAMNLAGCYELKEAFSAFAKRKDGRVLIEEGAMALLQDNLQEKERTFHDVAIARINEFEGKLKALYAERDALSNQEMERKENALADIWKATSKVIYDELDFDYQPRALTNRSVLPSKTIRFSEKKTGLFARNMQSAISSPRRSTFLVRSGGWKNIDCMSPNLLFSKQPVNIRNGNKTSRLDFTSLDVTIENETYYDKVFAYLIPQNTSSFIRLERLTGTSTYSTERNNKLKYDVVIIAHKGEMVFADRRQNVNVGKLHFDELLPRTAPELKNLLDDYYKQLNDDTTAQLEFERVNTNIKKMNASTALNDKKRKDLLPVVFPNKCGESLGKGKKAGRVITMPSETKEALP